MERKNFEVRRKRNVRGYYCYGKKHSETCFVCSRAAEAAAARDFGGGLTWRMDWG